MSLPNQLFTPSFRHQKLHWFFAFIVGIMVYVATFATAAEASLSAITFTWNQGMENHLTIEIPAVDDESSSNQNDRIKQVTAILRAIPGIDQVKRLPEDESLKLLKPWIGEEALKSLPLPTLLDVTRDETSTLTASDIEERLRNTISDVTVDDHAVWLQDLAHLIRGLAIMGGLMILLTAVTLVIAVSLMCRAIMATERETIVLLHIMGAEDADIAKHFEQQARRLSWPSSFIGFGLAIVSAALLLFFLRHFADPTALAPLQWVGLGAMVLLVPFVAVGIASMSARIAALKLLYAEP